MIDLAGKTILISGASKGIGRALAERLTSEKAKLILIARNEEKLKEFVAKYGDLHRYYVCDLRSIEELKKLATKINREVTELDILVNNAGIGVYKPIPEVSEDEWTDTINLNVTAPYMMTKLLLSKLQQSSHSLVMNIGSGAGVIPMKNRSPYCTSKFALRGMTLSLAEEFRGLKPHMCLITLGSTLTDFANSNLQTKIEASKKGDAYFTLEWVANKLIEIMKDEKRKTENVLYPGEYGFGTWKKP